MEMLQSEREAGGLLLSAALLILIVLSSEDRIGQLYLECFNEREKCMTVIGGGKMATALVHGLVATGFLDKSEVYICSKSKETAFRWRTQGYPTSYSNDEFYGKVKKPRGVVLIAIKPQMFPNFLDEMRLNEWFYFGGPELLTVSIMAGIGLGTFKQQLESVGFNGHAARLMPNVNCLVSAGIVLVSTDSNIPSEMATLLLELGSRVGYSIRIEESLFNAASALASCAPAYIFTVIEALADGGVLNGLSREVSLRLAAEMVKGSAQLMLNSPPEITSPAQLKDKVCSPGGTTIAGMRELERAGIRSAFIEALTASTRRASEMSPTTNRQ
uniref:pyrroline-5-carboxylate reductase n=1 Tax=Globodera rostochiensis TaxID=31243 RepID=A0A914HZ04_GLORO